mmetsp:Transcript_1264/g.1866  ORF Transcript_1264/g.1866 Transcript_1264/m.1866 type:complete len:744 (-) Transcript_1264:684-2915(-)|eukprot:CAMPEP_0175078656 /NCGR_PEP_ID=MMETSP0052_2-20121109/24278_1 /TAXON_ID=51329 ORGANISM="Polytomella parva, Strain SAG 63-3" /NCGR_SAMPLE_ID=MMETSP0052_2 /ASSEMBLY_ACC=CAM_ASM_000194 /LENGTH=743 /DNA_ID=CAMNT_0016348679 /DNA_START=108 /DNA_END=2339 /DNA_ORIENTATION=-
MYTSFTKTTQVIFYNYKQSTVQNALDFDFICGRDIPSVAAIVIPGSAKSFQKVFFGPQEILIPSYGSTAEACQNHPKADVFINYASYRSAFAATMEALDQPTIRVVSMLAEGIPEKDSKKMILKVRQLNAAACAVAAGKAASIEPCPHPINGDTASNHSISPSSDGNSINHKQNHIIPDHISKKHLDPSSSLPHSSPQQPLPKMIIGPSSIGAVQAGALRIGDAAGTIDNILTCRLFRPGHVGFVSKSGGLLNEMFNVISRAADGVFEGVAIGGDAFPGSTLTDHCLRYEQIPEVAMIVLLGELGGADEYGISAAMKEGRITKPVVAWVSGTCARLFATEVQFGHAGAKSGGAAESAAAKMAALKEAGAHVPESYEGFEAQIKSVFDDLVASGKVVPTSKDIAPSRTLPLTLAAAVKKGLIRVPTHIISTISDDRGEEPVYGGVSIRQILQGCVESQGGRPEGLKVASAVKENGVDRETKRQHTATNGNNVFGDPVIGKTISLLWFRRELPPFALRFIEMCLVLCADHGPCVSGAHNAIVTARAGRDLVSAVASGLLTIGPRFGGAIDGAARGFKDAVAAGQSPSEFVELMKRQGRRVMGIGHKVKTRENPDARVELIDQFVREHFPTQKYLDYARKVEDYTLSKAQNLILNVDGCIAAAFLDLLSPESGFFTAAEGEEAVAAGTLNGLFLVARAMGLVGHALDQKRLGQNLYRHPVEDTLYVPTPAKTFAEVDDENGGAIIP